jgi:hypothetical protein
MDCWHDEIETAETEADIVRNASEYLLLWAPRELHPHELGLYDMRVRSYIDIESVNIHLCDMPEHANQAHLREIAAYFEHASKRISALRSDATRLPPMVAAAKAPSQSPRPRP